MYDPSSCRATEYKMRKEGPLTNFPFVSPDYVICINTGQRQPKAFQYPSPYSILIIVNLATALRHNRNSPVKVLLALIFTAKPTALQLSLGADRLPQPWNNDWSQFN